MNYKMVLSIIGKVMVIEACLMIFPLIVGAIYNENLYLAFLVPMLALTAIGLPLSLIKTQDKSIYAKEGFVTVALSWIVMSLFGALPFLLSGQIPNYIDAVFETVSGFTTTGGSILTEVESLYNGIQFWRLFTHWIGGMGVLVFVLAVLPATDAGIMHIFRAEAPGPSVGKLVSKLTFTARILYGIYIVFTMLEMVFLLCGGMPLLDSVLHAFSTAGTGGFGMKNNSVAYYDSVYIEMVIAVFMLIFSINFNLFYLILIGNFSKAIRNEELRVFAIIVILSTFAIALNLLSSGLKFFEALRYSFFQVASISSTTGFSSADFNAWPAFSKAILLTLTIVGACAGSTGGGIKVSRLIILGKSSYKDVKKMLHPRAAVTFKFEGEPLERNVERGVRSYFIIWVMIVVLCTMLLCLDFNDLFTNFTATLACIGNVGPGLNAVGPIGNYAFYSPFSKVLLSFVMLAGRLEIFPMMILFSPHTWRK
jgi:trk system potassium uptake protein TrkH